MNNLETMEVVMLVIAIVSAIYLYIAGIKIQKKALSKGIADIPDMTGYGPKQYSFLYKVLFTNTMENIFDNQEEVRYFKLIYLSIFLVMVIMLISAFL